MPLQMVDHHYGNIQSQAEGLGERRAYQQGSQQAGTAGKSYRREFRSIYAGPGKGLADHGHNVELVGAGGQFGHYAAIGLVHVLGGYDVGQQYAVTDDGR